MEDLKASLNSDNFFTKKSSTNLTIEFKDVSYIVEQVTKTRHSKLQLVPDKQISEKFILKNVSSRIHSGRLTAIMGSSGAGKTSLLQVLSGKSNSGIVSGDLFLNGCSVRPKDIKERSAFVFQDDLIMPTMTVKEAITFSSELRLPRAVNAQQRAERVEAAISLLGLRKCEHTPIGNSLIKGVSGGERKRCSIAMEIITDPNIIFLDEPTSGLDSFTAYSVVQTLKQVALSGRIVVATIHQPSAESFNLFDDLILLADGGVLYSGAVSGMVPYFENLGYRCPEHCNPADWLFMSILNKDDDADVFDNVDDDEKSETTDIATNVELFDEYETGEERTKKLLTTFNEKQASNVLEPIPADESWRLLKQGKTERAPMARQLAALFKRCSFNVLRNPMLLRARVGQGVIFGLVIGLVFLNVTHRTGYAGLQDITGMLFFVTLNSFMSTCMSVLAVFAEEKFIFHREHNANYYTLFPFFFSKVVVEFPANFLGPVIMYLMVYFMTDLYRKAAQFFIFVSIGLFLCLSAFGFGIFSAILFSDLKIALLAVPAIVMPLVLFSGLFSASNAIPPYFNWIQYISPMKYGYQAFMKNQFDHADLLMPNNEPPTPGQTVLEGLGLASSTWSIGSCIGMLIMMSAVLYSATYLLMLKQAMAGKRGAQWKSRKLSGGSSSSLKCMIALPGSAKKSSSDSMPSAKGSTGGKVADDSFSTELKMQEKAAS